MLYRTDELLGLYTDTKPRGLIFSFLLEISSTKGNRLLCPAIPKGLFISHQTSVIADISQEVISQEVISRVVSHPSSDIS
jgi:hypothetical protein